MDHHDSIIGRSLRPRGPILLSLSRRPSPDLVVLELSGEVDVLTMTRLASALDDEIRHGDGDVAVDMRGVSFLDSSGLHVLLGAQRRLARQDRGLGIIATPGPVLRVFELTRLTDTLEVASSARDYRRRRVSSLASRRTRGPGEGPARAANG